VVLRERWRGARRASFANGVMAAAGTRFDGCKKALRRKGVLNDTGQTNSVILSEAFWRPMRLELEDKFFRLI